MEMGKGEGLGTSEYVNNNNKVKKIKVYIFLKSLKNKIPKKMKTQNKLYMEILLQNHITNSKKEIITK